MKLSDIESQVKALAPILKGFIDKSVTAVRDEMTLATDEKLKALSDKTDASIMSLISLVSDLPTIDEEKIAKQAAELVEIPTPEKGEDGKSVEIDDLLPAILDAVGKAVSELPTPKDGEDGKSVTDEEIQAMVEKAIGKIEIVAPEDGRDALDLDILPAIDPEKSYPRGIYAMHNGGLWRSHSTTSDMRGWDCIVNGVQHHSTSQVDERTFQSTTLLSDGKLISNEFTMPVMLYKSVYKADYQYRKGDMVTCSGSLWHCDEDTTERPGGNDSKWTLCAKKGADGRKV